MTFDYCRLPPVVTNGLYDSVSKEPYQGAQMVNCGKHHSYSLSTVVELFGAMQGEACERSGPCPLCQEESPLSGRVSAYWDNQALQYLVDAILGKIYPVAKTHFIRHSVRFAENYEYLQLDKEFRGEHIDDAIESFSITICKRESHVRFFVSLDFHESKGLSALKIQEFAKNKGVSLFEFEQSILGIDFAEVKDVVAVAELIMQYNTFDKEAETRLKNILQWLKTLIPEPVTALPSEASPKVTLK